MKILGSWWLFLVALVVVAAVTLVAQSPPATSSSRIAHLETLVRCPSCEDLSVADSNATSAIALRHEITRRVHEGQSDQRILGSIEAVYGSRILLSPGARGLSLVLYLVPLAVLAALVLVVVRLRR